MEPLPGADPGGASLPRTRGRRSEGRVLGKRDSDAHFVASKASGFPITPFPTESPSPGSSWATALTGSGWTPVRGAWCARQDLNLRHPRPQRGLSAAGVRAHGAVTRCRTGPPALRGRGHKPCVTAKLRNQDSNLDSSGPEPDVLPVTPFPIKIRAEGGIRTRKPRSLSSRGLPVAFTSAWCAVRITISQPFA
jgi:hypothetical protein